MTVRTYKDLEVWQKAIDLVTEIYKCTEKFPATEKFGLSSQMQRSAISIPSNIAEGYRRFSRKEYARFVAIAFGSGAELETQLEIARRLGYLSKDRMGKVQEQVDPVMKMLNKLYQSLTKSATYPKS